MDILILFGVMFALMAIGVPIFLAMAGAALVTLAITGLGAATVLPNQMAAGVSSYELMAIPFFVLMGELMARAGLTQRIVDLLMYFLGRVKGGLAYATVGANAFASTVSGSAPAAATMVGTSMIPAMRRAGYRQPFTAGLSASAAILGPVFPPSVPMIFVALVTGLSVGQLFIGGIVPAILMAVSLLIIVAWKAQRGTIPGKVEVSTGDSLSLSRLTFRAIPSLLTPVFIVIGVIGGFVTITEVAIVAASYAFLLGLVYRTITPRQIPSIFYSTSVFSSTIMMLFAAVGGFTYLVATLRVGDQIAEFVDEQDMSPFVFLLAAMAFFLIIGMVLDAIPAILIFLPVLLPVAIDLGLDPIHFSVLVVVNLMIGLITPPVGALLYVLAKLARVDFMALVKEEFPFLIGLLVVLFILVFLPGLVTFLPGLFFS